MSFADAVVGFAKAMNAMNGRGRIERLCAEVGWSIDRRHNNAIVLDFKCPVVGTRSIYITDDSTIEFKAYSLAIVPPSQIPEEVFAYLLLRNTTQVGKWQMEEGKDGNVFFAVSYMAVAEGLNARIFKTLCEGMVRETSNFDQRMQKAGVL